MNSVHSVTLACGEAHRTFLVVHAFDNVIYEQPLMQALATIDVTFYDNPSGIPMEVQWLLRQFRWCLTLSHYELDKQDLA